LGEGGADKLSGNGDMYFVSPKHEGFEYLKGAYNTPDEIDTVCDHVRSKYEKTEWDDSYKFVIDFDEFQQNAIEDGLIDNPANTEQDIENKLFAKIIMWTLKNDTVSARKIKDSFEIGWPNARLFLERLYKLKIVDVAYGKLARKVLSTCFEDLLPETVTFLARYAYTEESVRGIFATMKEEV